MTWCSRAPGTVVIRLKDGAKLLVRRVAYAYFRVAGTVQICKEEKTTNRLRIASHR